MADFLNILKKVKDKALPQKGSDNPGKGSPQSERNPVSAQKNEQEKAQPQGNVNKLQEDWKNLIKELTTTDIRFYFLKDEYLTKINQMYYNNAKDLEEIGISQRKFIDFIRESFERIKQAQKQLPLEPMNQKFYEYVEKCVKELMSGLRQKFKK